MAFRRNDIDVFIKVTNCDGVDPKEIYEDFVKILLQSDTFSKLIPIRRGRVPIIKCIHKPTGYNLDLSMTSEAGIYISRFVGEVLRIDPRIHALMVIVKTWGKSWDIIKCGGIPSYCITMLIFYFLQSCNEPLIPSVKEMQEEAESIVVDLIDYGVDASKFKPENNDSVGELLRKFFMFYSNFNFETNIISPYLAKAIDRYDFKSNSFKFPEYHQQLERIKSGMATNSNPSLDNNVQPLDCSTPMVLQDPFLLNENKAKCVGDKLFIKFKNHLIYASKICEEGAGSNQHFNKLLQRLFYEEPELSIATYTTQQDVKKKRQTKKKRERAEQTKNLQNELKTIVINALDTSPPDAEVATLCGIFQPEVDELQSVLQTVETDLMKTLNETYTIEVIPFGSMLHFNPSSFRK